MSDNITGLPVKKSPHGSVILNQPTHGDYDVDDLISGYDGLWRLMEFVNEEHGLGIDVGVRSAIKVFTSELIRCRYGDGS